MSDGSSQGVSESSPQLEVDAEKLQTEYSSVLEPIREGVEDNNSNSNSNNNNEGNKGDTRDGQIDRLESSDDDDVDVDDDDQLIRELKAELEKTTFWQSNSEQQHRVNEETRQQPPSSSSQVHYTSKIAVLMETMNEDQMNRFEAFRRSTLSRANMKKLVSSLINQTMNDEKVNIVLCSLSKMFVGDLIETARRIANAEQHVGPLTRSHVYQAYKALGKRNNKLMKRRAGRFFGRL